MVPIFIKIICYQQSAGLTDTLSFDPLADAMRVREHSLLKAGWAPMPSRVYALGISLDHTELYANVAKTTRYIYVITDLSELKYVNERSSMERRVGHLGCFTASPIMVGFNSTSEKSNNASAYVKAAVKGHQGLHQKQS